MTTPTSPKKSIFSSFIFRFGVSGALLWFIFRKIDWPKTIDVIKSADPNFLILAFVVFFSINFFLLWRWFIFIRAVGLNSKAKDVIRYFFIGLFGNLFLPSAIGGDIIKILGLCKDSVQKPKVVASVLLDRLSGFAAIVLVAVTSFFLGYRYHQEKSLILPIIAMAGVSLTLALILFNEHIYGFCCKVFNKFPKAKTSLMNLHYDIMLLKDKKGEGIKAIIISCLSQLTLAVVYYLTALALHQNISLIYFIIFVPIICVAATFPSIGGLGFREAGAAYLFAKVGIDSGIAVSLSLINFIFMVMVGLIGGLIYVTTLSSRRLQHHPSDASVVNKKT